MAGTLTLTQAKDPKLEQYAMELTIPDAEKQQFLSDIGSYVQKALEANGQTVNRILLTMDFVKKANDVIGQSKPGMPVILTGGNYHIAWPERSSWI